jgi:hypothetical protein
MAWLAKLAPHVLFLFLQLGFPKLTKKQNNPIIRGPEKSTFTWFYYRVIEIIS